MKSLSARGTIVYWVKPLVRFYSILFGFKLRRDDTPLVEPLGGERSSERGGWMKKGWKRELDRRHRR